MQNPDTESHSLHAGVHGHAELMPEARLLEAHQPTAPGSVRLKSKSELLFCSVSMMDNQLQEITFRIKYHSTKLHSLRFWFKKQSSNRVAVKAAHLTDYAVVAREKEFKSAWDFCNDKGEYFKKISLRRQKHVR